MSVSGTVEISYFDRRSGFPLAIADCVFPRLPDPPSDGSVAIAIEIDGPIKWGFDGGWHDDQPREWELLDELERTVTVVCEAPHELCIQPVTHIDEDGCTYCEEHSRCGDRSRPLLDSELSRLRAGMSNTDFFV